MRIYVRSIDNLSFEGQRAFFEAQNGRVHLALERLLDLTKDFPDQAYLAWAEATIRSEFLGQGINARTLYERAIVLAHSPIEIDRVSREKSIEVDTWFARNEEEFRLWADRAQSSGLGVDPTIELNQILEALDSGAPYYQVARDLSIKTAEAGDHGNSAAIMEIALKAEEIPLLEEAQMREHRAYQLRALDQQAAQRREAMHEAFPADEREALQDALAEIERVLTISSSRAECWNWKSAWLILLGRHEEAVAAAERGISERPYNYPKPYINKATALRALGQDGPAFITAQEARQHAEDALKMDPENASNSDLKHALALCDAYAHPRPIPNWHDILLPIEKILLVAKRTSELKLAQFDNNPSLKDIIARVRSHLYQVGDRLAHGYIAMMAEVLTDFTPETVYQVLDALQKSAPHVNKACVTALLYIITHADSVLQRDAARLLALTILAQKNPKEIRGYYRRWVFVPAIADPNVLPGLEAIMTDAFERLNPTFPMLLRDHAPISDDEHTWSIRNIIDPLSGSPPPPNPNQGAKSATSRRRVTCMVLLVFFACWLLWALWYLTQGR